MTIGTTASRALYNGDGASTVFPVPIQAYQASDFTVLATNTTTGSVFALVLNSDYTLVASSTDAPPKWTLTTLTGQIPSPYAVGYVLQVFINPVRQQQTQYVQGQAFPSLAVQTNFDRLTQMVQRLEDQLGRAIHTPDGDVSPAMLLPTAAARANTYPSFDGAGNLSVAVSVPSGTLSQSSIGAFLWPRTANEISSGVVPTAFFYPPGDVRRYGADATGAASSASAFQQAANANKSVVMPEGVYKIDAQVNCAGRQVCFSGASRGSVTLNLSTAVDAFKWTTAFVTGAGFRHAVLDVGGMTGGFALSLQGQNRIVINDLTIRTNSLGAGAIYLEDINAIGLRDIWGNANFGTNGAFIKAVGTTATSFNVLDLDDIQYGGTGGAASTSSDFLVLEGGVNTVDMRHCGAVACRFGVITTNPAALTSFGEFIDATDTQFDGLWGTAVILGTAGAGTTGTHYFNQLYIHNSGANNAGVTALDGHGMYIYPNCREASFQGGVIVTCKLNGVYNDGNGIRFSDFKISKNSQLAVGTYPGFQLGPSSYECKVFDNMIGQHTGSSTSDMSYGVQLDLGSARNTVTGNTLFLNTLGPILNNSGDVNTQIQNNLYAGNMTFSPALGPAAMGATVNNYNPTNWSINVKRLRLTPNAGDTTITGLFTGVGATTWTDGTTLLVQNLSAADNVKLSHLNGASNAWNQFSLPSAATLTIPPLGTQQIMYDGVLSKWIKA